MDASREAFRGYLSPNEVVVSADDGTLIERGIGSDGTVCLTDRRLLFVSSDGVFRDVSYEYVRSIRSRPRRTDTARRWRLGSMAVLGGAIAAVAFLGAIVLASNASGVVFAAAVVGASVLAESVRRVGVDSESLKRRVVELDHNAAVGSLLGGGTTAGRKRDRDDSRTHWRTEYVYVTLFLVAVTAATVILAAALLVGTGQWIVFSLTIVTLGGLATAEYAVRRLRWLDRTGRDRHETREIRLEIDGSDDVAIRCHASTRIDRTLSRLATGKESSHTDTALTEPTDAGRESI